VSTGGCAGLILLYNGDNAKCLLNERRRTNQNFNSNWVFSLAVCDVGAIMGKNGWFYYPFPCFGLIFCLYNLIQKKQLYDIVF
jgi:hypothetical protein